MPLRSQPERLNVYKYSLPGFNFQHLNEIFIQQHSAYQFDPQVKGFLDLVPQDIEINSAFFLNDDLLTWVIVKDDHLLLSCTCCSVDNKLCVHQARALYNILKKAELRLFFDDLERKAEFKKAATSFGLEGESDIETYFRLEYKDKQTLILPVSESLFPVSSYKSVKAFQSSRSIPSAPRFQAKKSHSEVFVVFRQHKYYKHLTLELFEAALTQTGKPKNPLSPVNIQERIWQSDDQTLSKFYFGISTLQNRTANERSDNTIRALKSVLKNPDHLRFFQHNNSLSENVTASSLMFFHTGDLVKDIELRVNYKKPFFEVTATLVIDESKFAIELATIRFDYFVEINNKYHLAGNIKTLEKIELFQRHNNKLLIHESKYQEFKTEVLDKLEEDTEIVYTYVPVATQEQIEKYSLTASPQRFIYLKDSDPFVELEPVMKYGDEEIPILSKKQLHPKGIKTAFRINRDKIAELNFISLILKQHDYFREQAEEALPYFYLHKKNFLDETWFLKTFEEWQNQGITILGFNNLNNNKLNPNPAKITVRLLSGIDWFNAEIDLRFGKKKARLQQINKALRNKSKYITLDDGTLGILPEQWLEKFAEYFSKGDIEDGLLKIPKSHFNTISQLFEDEVLTPNVKAEIAELKKRLSTFQNIEDVPVPKELKATLRDYQKQGLNWLNFLDDFNFGGCLADDMGLGKTVQILAFILSQRNKRRDKNTNLLVVPTSLIFNWQAEIDKFAPSLKVHILYGANRLSNTEKFSNHELIITSYGALLSDIRFLKNFEFNYIFLDESQNIKNPDSQRYKAARLLKSRNKIAITGTPVENNTFDLYGQLSFACPGLLGNKQYFKDIYLMPIDQFGDKKRMIELQEKIAPFILRRTKKEVVHELPEKTEMLLHCEMNPEQQKIYDAFEREFRDFICSKTEDEIPKSSIHVLKGLTRLRQICNSPLLLNDDDIHERSSSKIDALMEQIVNKSPQHKILVFSQFVSMLDLIKLALEEHGIKYCYLSGSTKNRDLVVRKFQEDDTQRVFLISLKAGGTGLNLTQADYVYLVDPWWNPAVENQAIDRIYRIGQRKNVVAVRLICPNTIEEKIVQMQESKRELFQNLIADKAKPMSFTKDEVLSMLR